MNMDAKIDALAETCAINGMDKQALGPVGAKLTAGAILALAGGAAGAGMGYMFDRGRQDPDESPSVRVRKMKQRMLTGAGIGAAAGGLGGLLLGTDKVQMEPHQRERALLDATAGVRTGGRQQEAIIKEVAGTPVRTGLLAQLGRGAADASPITGTDMNPYVEAVGTAALPAGYWLNRNAILRNSGIRNFWSAARGAEAAPRSVFSALAEGTRFPRSINYASRMSGSAADAARLEILRGIVSRQQAEALGNLPVLRSNVRNVPSWATPATAVGKGWRAGMPHMMQVGTAAPGVANEAELWRQMSPGVASRVRAGNFGPTATATTVARLQGRTSVPGDYRDIVERVMRRRTGVPAEQYHAGTVFGKKIGFTPRAANLAMVRKYTVAAVLSNLISRHLNNVYFNMRTRGVAEDAAKKLVAQ